MNTNTNTNITDDSELDLWMNTQFLDLDNTIPLSAQLNNESGQIPLFAPSPITTITPITPMFQPVSQLTTTQLPQMPFTASGIQSPMNMAPTMEVGGIGHGIIPVLPSTSTSPITNTNNSDLDLWMNTQFFDLDNATPLSTTLNPFLPTSTFSVTHPTESTSTLSKRERSKNIDKIIGISEKFTRFKGPLPVSSPTLSLASSCDQPAEEVKEKEQEKDMTAEELEKRRRNTAASARFRAKKKMREQALEKAVDTYAARCDQLEKRVKGKL